MTKVYQYVLTRMTGWSFARFVKYGSAALDRGGQLIICSPYLFHIHPSVFITCSPTCV